ncbi:hypothetical protein BDZ94DRAFT_1254748 [Collybia nuda]|uniref:Uncharacterized protein n=1 Tax=Collybia nuda TaxID=64659 RepID=A0A9P6CGL1_9AGAR|nr:hypothetical protein BDZ94DRAFT_1254748 [Collybia nuda]
MGYHEIHGSISVTTIRNLGHTCKEILSCVPGSTTILSAEQILGNTGCHLLIGIQKARSLEMKGSSELDTIGCLCILQNHSNIQGSLHPTLILYHSLGLSCIASAGRSWRGGSYRKRPLPVFFSRCPLTPGREI